MIDDPAWDVRRSVVEALGNLQKGPATEALITRLKDPDTDVRESAALALGRTHDPSAIRPLILAIKDPETIVRSAAALALRRLDPQWHQSAAAQEAVPELRAALKNKEYWVRQSAAEVLAQIGAKQLYANSESGVTNPAQHKRLATVEILAETLDDADPDLRLAAAEALGRVGDSRAREALSRALEDLEATVRAAAGRALATLQPAQLKMQMLT